MRGNRSAGEWSTSYRRLATRRGGANTIPDIGRVRGFEWVLTRQGVTTALAAIFLVWFPFSAVSVPYLDPVFAPVLARWTTFLGPMVKLSDGRILVTGAFTCVNGDKQEWLAKLDSRGRLDPAFHPQFDILDDDTERPGCAVVACAVQPDGRILVGGRFSSIDGVPRRCLARLLPGGELDETFDPFPESGVRFEFLESISLGRDGSIVLTGNFCNWDWEILGPVIWLRPDGTLDRLLNQPPPGAVAFAPMADGQVFFHPLTSGPGTPVRQACGRVDRNGIVDPHFNPPLPGVLAGQEFIRYTVSIEDGSLILFVEAMDSPRGRLVRIEESGELDDTFQVNVEESAWIQPLAGGRLLVVNAGTVNGIPCPGLVILDRDGSIDPSFVSDSGEIYVIPRGVEMEDGSLVVSASLRQLMRIERSGETDRTFDPFFGSAGGARKIVARSGGDVVVAGEFERAGVKPAHSLAIFDRASGEPKPIPWELEVPPGSLLRDVAVTRDDGLVVATDHLDAEHRYRNRIVKFQADGHRDPAFTSALPDSGSVARLLVDFTGAVLASGWWRLPGQDLPRAQILRLLPDGSVDPSFTVPLESASMETWVKSLQICADGRIYVAGHFTSIHGVPQGCLARLHPDGRLDEEFRPKITGFVHACASTPDNGVVIAGNLWEVNGERDRPLAWLDAEGRLRAGFPPPLEPVAHGLALHVLEDGSLLVAGPFERVAGVPCRGLARFHASGDWDPDFRIAESLECSKAWWDTPITAMTSDSEGSLLITGGFTACAGRTRIGVARFRTRPKLSSLIAAPGPAFRLELLGFPGQELALEGSLDLERWAPFDNFTMPADSRLSVTSSLPSGPMHFFRAVAR